MAHLDPPQDPIAGEWEPQQELADPVAEFSDSDEDSLHSEPVDVLLRKDVLGYQSSVTIGKLNRNTFRRLLWRNKFSSIMVKMLLLVTFDSAALFIVNVEKFGLEFIHATVILMFFVGYPLVYLETALGQYTSTNAFFVFKRLAPAFGGIGIMAFINNILSLLSIILITPVYVFGLFQVTMTDYRQFPWHSCLTMLNRPVCRVMYLECNRELSSHKIINHMLTEGIYSRGAFCFNSMLVKEATKQLDVGAIDEVSFESWISGSSLFQTMVPYLNNPHYEYDMPPHMIVKVFTMWLLVWAVLSIGERAVKVLAFLTFSTGMGFSIILTFFFNGDLMKADFLYFHALFEKNKTMFNSSTIWAKALIFVIRSLRLGEGVHIYFGAQNDFTNGISQDAFIAICLVLLGPCVMSLYNGFICDSLVLHLVDGNLQRFLKAKALMSNSLWQFSTDSVLRTVFTMEAFGMFGYHEAGLMFTYTLSGIFVIIGVAVLRVEIIWRTICDVCFSVTDKISPKIILHIVLCVIGLSLLLFSSETAYKMGVQIQENVAITVSFSVLVLEIIAITAVYGPRRFFTNTVCMRKMRDENFPLIHLTRSAFMLFVWCILVPILMIPVLLSDWTLEVWMTSKIMLAVIFFIAPTYFAAKMITCYIETRTFSLALSPDPDLWGPRRAADRATAEFVNRKFKKSN